MAAVILPSPSALGTAVNELLQWLWNAVPAMPPAIQARAQRLWLDTVSCAYSGLQAPEPQRWLAAQATTEAGPVPLPGSAIQLGAGAAATAFALGACWDEACEGLALAHGRPGVPVVAALWTQLASVRPSWLALWQATAVGYEVAARLGAVLRIRPGMHVDGVWGAFGAAAALVHLRGGTASEAAAAIQACATQLPFTLYRPVREGANVRNTYLGHSAWLGLQGARAALGGLGTPEGALDDVASLMLDPTSAGAWPAHGPWLMLDSYWKPFAAVRHLHYGAQAACAWFALGEDAAGLTAVELHTYPEALVYCGNRAPLTPLAAQFSLSFGVAAALAFGGLSPAEFRQPRFFDSQLRRLETLVQVLPDPYAYPGAMRGARLELRAGPRQWCMEQGAVTGDPGYEPDAAQVMAKFERYTGRDKAMAKWAERVLQDELQSAAFWPSAWAAAPVSDHAV
jgi:2-methylcitrate dehydratase PrpD